jgi:hypothetical protein
MAAMIFSSPAPQFGQCCMSSNAEALLSPRREEREVALERRIESAEAQLRLRRRL